MKLSLLSSTYKPFSQITDVNDPGLMSKRSTLSYFPSCVSELYINIYCKMNYECSHECSTLSKYFIELHGEIIKEGVYMEVLI